MHIIEQNMKYSDDFKIDLVKKYLSEKETTTQRTFAVLNSINVSTFRNWLTKFSDGTHIKSDIPEKTEKAAAAALKNKEEKEKEDQSKRNQAVKEVQPFSFPEHVCDIRPSEAATFTTRSSREKKTDEALDDGMLTIVELMDETSKPTHTQLLDSFDFLARNLREGTVMKLRADLGPTNTELYNFDNEITMVRRGALASFQKTIGEYCEGLDEERPNRSARYRDYVVEQYRRDLQEVWTGTLEEYSKVLREVQTEMRIYYRRELDRRYSAAKSNLVKSLKSAKTRTRRRGEGGLMGESERRMTRSRTGSI